MRNIVRFDQLLFSFMKMFSFIKTHKNFIKIDFYSYVCSTTGVSSKHSKSCLTNSSASSSLSPPNASTPIEPTPTANLDRTGDAVYQYTMSVVCAVRQLLQGVQESRTADYID